MKKIICSITILMVMHLGSFPVLKADSGKVITTIKCPSGEKYLCYTSASGEPVRKGKGETEVTVETVE